jgi:hypothetical protein
MQSSSRRILVVLGLVVSTAVLAAADHAPVASFVSPRPAAAIERPLARLEPATGTYFGASLDWDHDSISAYAERLGHPAAVYVAFTHFPVEDTDSTYLNTYMDQVHAQQGLALLTVEPTVALDDITPAMATQLAERLAVYNAAGVPVLLRFAHEMNGSWYAWGQQPGAYARAFRLVASAIHERASDTAMLWAPNYGGGYPFSGGGYQARPGSTDFARLDTNHDGRLDSQDDMYGPYYPGDDAVDWVGMTLYHWGDAWPWGKNVIPEDGKFLAQLTGAYDGAGGDDRGLPNFYQVYAEGHGKPLAIPETAAFYNTSVGGDSELDIKRAWWRQVFSPTVARQLPALKMINWFEWRKPEPEVNNAVVDWTATQDPAIRSAFVADLPLQQLLFAPSVSRVVDPEPATPTQTSPDIVATTPQAGPVADPQSTLAPEGDEAEDYRRTIQFSGYSWRVRSASSLEGPGPNYFSDSPDSVWLDGAGRLHLRVAPTEDGRWYAAEILGTTSLGYGTYRFTLDSRLDALDPNVALGLFTWSDDAADNHRELDIEFARFGQPTAPIGRYTLQPYTSEGNVFLFTQPESLESTHSFRWEPDGVAFRSGIDASGAPGRTDTGIAQHVFSGSTPHTGDERVHLNLWLDAGRAPADSQPVEVIVRNFAFTPLP